MKFNQLRIIYVTVYMKRDHFTRLINLQNGSEKKFFFPTCTRSQAFQLYLHAKFHQKLALFGLARCKVDHFEFTKWKSAVIKQYGAKEGAIAVNLRCMFISLDHEDKGALLGVLDLAPPLSIYSQ